MENARILWDSFDARYVDHFRLATWALFNLPVPNELLVEGAAPMVPTLSALRIYHSAMDFRLLGRWLSSRGVGAVSDFNASLMSEYAEYLRSERRMARATAVNHLAALTRLWIIGLQLPVLALPDAPPWVRGRADDYLPAREGGRGENETEPIATATIAPLLHAATRFIETGAGPIQAAVARERAIYDHCRSKAEPRRDGAARLRAYLETLVASGQPLPSKLHNGQMVLDCAYVAYTVGVPLSAVYNWRRAPFVVSYAAEHSAPVTVALNGSDLMPTRIPRTEVSTYSNLLQAACFIVIAYLTGMRPGEVLALESGSLRSASDADGWMLLDSRTFKTVRDADGNHDSNGQIREAPWVAVTPVVAAIRSLERLQSTGLLFPSAQHVRNAGRSVGITTISDVIARFIDHVNGQARSRIPEDPLGRVTPSRFRRTLAWHIANQPNGLVALAIQYGHLRTAISEGYASRVRDGIQDLVEFETAKAIAKHLAEAAESVKEGGGVSGPAALRFVAALREQSAQFSGIISTQRQAQRLLGNPKLTVYQNDKAFLACNFNRSTALCLSSNESDDAATPRLNRCKPGCTNISRADSDAVALSEEAAALRHQASYMPQPAADRLQSRANRLEQLALSHRTTRLRNGAGDAQ